MSGSLFFSLGATLLAIAWLLPNHSMPWSSFHADAWSAVALLFICLPAFFSRVDRFRASALFWVTLAFSLYPLLQFFFGVLPFAGSALVCSLYLGGFSLTMLAGERSAAAQRFRAADVIFLAAVIGGLFSVWLQLCQWTGLDKGQELTQIWIIGLGDTTRPYGNLGQPNQLATLLLWALVGCLWARWNRAIGNLGLAVLAAFFVLGLALTQSRSGLLGFCLGCLLLWVWPPLRGLVSWKSLLAFLAFYFLVSAAFRPISRFLLLDEGRAFADAASSRIRLRSWEMFGDAILREPWRGYGWSGVKDAHVQMAPRYPDLSDAVFAQSHNLFIDFFLWGGVGLGVVLSGVVLFWGWLAFQRATTPKAAILVLALMAIGIHALLEYPLHYAYFLLPAGVLLGVLNQEARLPLVRGHWGRWQVVVTRGALSLSAVLLGLVVVDYFKVEQTVQDMRFEDARIRMSAPAELPDVMVLNHLRENLAFIRYEPHAEMSLKDIAWARAVVFDNPSSPNVLKLALVYLLNGQPEQSDEWLRRGYFITPERSRSMFVQQWARILLEHPGHGPSSFNAHEFLAGAAQEAG
ncbi:Wzy polymerase domain-containing protein [Variovorax sp. LT1R16]|uniref:PglL family O-oligosaccharyltransferase n=1 Tax=Variovorax sp. LT1R16 TaxID=3443728 RepID=UPI003F4679C5